MKTTSSTVQTALSKLDQARALQLPSREAMLHRDSSVSMFWSQHRNLLRDAWQEWEQALQAKLMIPNDSLLDPTLREAVEAAWDDPTKELAVENLWEEVSPGRRAWKYRTNSSCG